MLINKIEIMNAAEIAMNGDIYFEKKKDVVIKLGTFKFDKKYGHLTIDLGNVCRIDYERYHDTEVVGDMDFKYWFKSQFICDRFHGRPAPDHEWVVDMFNDVSVYSEEVNNLIVIMIKKLFAKCDSFNAGTHQETKADTAKAKSKVNGVRMTKEEYEAIVNDGNAIIDRLFGDIFKMIDDIK